MFYVEFTRKMNVAALDAADVHWTRLLTEYADRQTADDECFWMDQEDDSYLYRVVEVPL